MFIAILYSAAGLALLAGGAELLVRGASKLAAAAGISPLVIGLTIVAFGTSTPELAVSISASWTGHGDVAMGNAVGSNTFNVLFIFGVSALVRPLAVQLQLIKFDLPVMICASALLPLAALDGELSRVEGLVFVALLVGYVWKLIRTSRRETQAAVLAEFAQQFGPQIKPPAERIWVQLLLIVAGLGVLTGGMHLLLNGSMTLARLAGVSERVIGLTLVAAGTSMPEVFTSVVAAWKGKPDIAVGNVVGSNIFNILGVLGIASTAAPHGIAVTPGVLRVDMPVALFAAAVCLPVFITGRVASRWEGMVFLAGYAGYLGYLFMQ